MKRTLFITGAVISLFICVAVYAQPNDVRVDLTEDITTWEVPGWSIGNEAYVARALTVDGTFGHDGKPSLKIMCAFPGDRWAAVMVEEELDISLEGYNTVSAWVYLPAEARSNLISARIILTVGEGWYFVEKAQATELKRGAWTMVTGKLDVSPSGEMSYWKCENKEACLLNNINDIKRIGVRIEYNANPSLAGPAYDGPVYVSDISIE